MAPDAYSYGDRDESSPADRRGSSAGDSRPHRLAEDSMVKFNLWFGRTHWGMMVRDDQTLDLCAADRK